MCEAVPEVSRGRGGLSCCEKWAGLGPPGVAGLQSLCGHFPQETPESPRVLCPHLALQAHVRSLPLQIQVDGRWASSVTSPAQVRAVL